MSKGDQQQKEVSKESKEPKFTAAPKTPEAPKVPKEIKVRLFATLPRQGGLVVFDEEGIYYHVADGTDIQFVRGSAEVYPDKLVKCYDWKKEIDAMLPTRAEIIKNIQRSILRAGGVHPGMGNESRYLNAAFNMYALPTKEEEK